MIGFRRFRSLPLGALLGFCVALLLQHPGAARDYTEAQDFFMRGVRAHDEGNYAEAITLLAEAARRDGKEALASFRYKGLNTEDYLPHFYLGRCYEKVGRNAEALAAFRESEKQGAIRGRASLSAILRTSLAKLEASLPAPSPTPAPAVEARVTAVPSPVPSPAVVAVTRPTAPAVVPTATALPREDYVRADVPRELREEVSKGMRAFFQAEYEDAIKALEPLAAKVPKARAFLAYSRAALWLTRGGDGSPLAQAREDYRQARKFIRADSERKWISPEILRVLSSSDPPQRKR